METRHCIIRVGGDPDLTCQANGPVLPLSPALVSQVSVPLASGVDELMGGVLASGLDALGNPGGQ